MCFACCFALSYNIFYFYDKMAKAIESEKLSVNLTDMPLLYCILQSNIILYAHSYTLDIHIMPCYAICIHIFRAIDEILTYTCCNAGWRNNISSKV